MTSDSTSGSAPFFSLSASLWSTCHGTRPVPEGGSTSGGPHVGHQPDDWRSSPRAAGRLIRADPDQPVYAIRAELARCVRCGTALLRISPAAATDLDATSVVFEVTGVAVSEADYRRVGFNPDDDVDLPLIVEDEG